MNKTINFTSKERDAILTGLRLLERELSFDDGLDPEFDEIFTNCGEHEGLDYEQFDSLCERINVE